MSLGHGTPLIFEHWLGILKVRKYVSMLLTIRSRSPYDSVLHRVVSGSSQTPTELHFRYAIPETTLFWIVNKAHCYCFVVAWWLNHWIIWTSSEDTLIIIPPPFSKVRLTTEKHCSLMLYCEKSLKFIKTKTFYGKVIVEDITSLGWSYNSLQPDK